MYALAIAYARSKRVRTPKGETVSDQSMTPQSASKPSDTSKQKRSRAKRDSFSVTDLARARLRARGIKSDDRLTSECKVVRGILRANFADVRKNDAAVRKAKDAPNDRRPWPNNMNRATYERVVKGKR